MTLVIDGREPRRVKKAYTPTGLAKKPLILCIDDDPGLQSAIEMRLRRYEVEMHHAFYGMQGIWESVHDSPDLILLDVAMPNGDGRYVLRCLRTNQKTALVPIIVLTGMRDPKLIHEFLMAGADKYLRKPISGDALVEQIRRYIPLNERPEDESS
jgi:DNA-binding response OmpR family regulator